MPNPHTTTARLATLAEFREFTHDTVNGAFMSVATVVSDQHGARSATILGWASDASLVLHVTSTTTAGARNIKIPVRNLACNNAFCSVALANLRAGRALATAKCGSLDYSTSCVVSTTTAGLRTFRPRLPLTHLTVKRAVLLVAVSEFLVIRTGFTAIERFTGNTPSPHFKTSTTRLRAR